MKKLTDIKFAGHSHSMYNKASNLSVQVLNSNLRITKKKSTRFRGKEILLAFFCISLISCTDSVYSEHEQNTDSVKLCQGTDCDEYPDSGYKPTKEERTRVMRGEKPDFGSEKKGIKVSF